MFNLYLVIVGLIYLIYLRIERKGKREEINSVIRF